MSTLHLVCAVVGVAGVLLALLSTTVVRWPLTDPRLFAAGTIAVAVSVVASGVIAAPATRRCGRARQDASS